MASESIIFKYGAVLLILGFCLLGFTSANPAKMEKKSFSFFDIDCKGTYDRRIFNQMERVCEDCYNLYREPQLHYLCRSNCFGSPFFKGCLEALMQGEDEHKYEEMIEILGKK